jgi:hypothetical protein
MEGFIGRWSFTVCMKGFIVDLGGEFGRYYGKMAAFRASGQGYKIEIASEPQGECSQVRFGYGGRWVGESGGD